jgi:cell division septal protein FtsQ
MLTRNKFLLFLGSFVLLLFWFYYPVRSVIVIGRFNSLDKDKIYQTLNKNLSTGVYGLSLSDIQHQLLTLSGIEDAKVWRCWPGDLIVSLKARDPFVRYFAGGFVDKSGVLFYPSKNLYAKEQLPILNVDKDFLFAGTSLLLGMQQVLGNDLVINSLRFSPGVGWEVSMSKNIKIMLPEKKSLVLFDKFIKHRKAIRRFHDISVDLRYLNGFAVKNI